MAKTYSPALHIYDKIKLDMFKASHVVPHEGATEAEQHLYAQLKEIATEAWLKMSVHTAPTRQLLLTEEDTGVKADQLTLAELRAKFSQSQI